MDTILQTAVKHKLFRQSLADGKPPFELIGGENQCRISAACKPCLLACVIA